MILGANDESQWWDYCGGTLDMSLGYIERDHDCYKDKRIIKVFIFYSFTENAQKISLRGKSFSVSVKNIHLLLSIVVQILLYKLKNNYIKNE